jgi:hypothetical protein
MPDLFTSSSPDSQITSKSTHSQPISVSKISKRSKLNYGAMSNSVLKVPQVISFRDPTTSTPPLPFQDKSEKRKFLSSNMRTLLCPPSSEEDEGKTSLPAKKGSNLTEDEIAQERVLEKLDGELAGLLRLKNEEISISKLLAVAEPSLTTSRDVTNLKGKGKGKEKQIHSRKIIRLSTSSKDRRSLLEDSKNQVDEKGGGHRTFKTIREKRKEEMEGGKGRTVRKRVGGTDSGERERRGLRLGRMDVGGKKIKLGKDGILRIRGVKG